MITLNLVPSNIIGFDKSEVDRLQALIDVFERHQAKNLVKNKYYEGKVSLGEVNLGIALPEGMRGLEIGCAWGAKTVDVLAASDAHPEAEIDRVTTPGGLTIKGLNAMEAAGFTHSVIEGLRASTKR